MNRVFDQALMAYNKEMKKLDDLYRSAAKNCGMAECAFWILYTLRVEEKSFTQAEICEFLVEPKQTVNSALKKLVAEGYLALSAGTDQRSKLVRLTPKGDQLARERVDRIPEAEAAALRRSGCEVVLLTGDNQRTAEAIARQVGVGAVIFGALSNSKIKDIAFSYSKILNFDGETGPYVQYTAARIKSVLRKGGAIGKYEIKNVNEDEYQLIALLSTFPDVVKAAAERLEPFFVTRYAIDVASAFNKFYFDCKIIGDDANETNFRLAISSATLTVLSSALTLLGIKVPERM